MSTYVTADLHLGHDKLAIFRGFSDLDSHDDFLLQQACSVLKAEDTLIILGDIVFGKPEEKQKRFSKYLLGLPCGVKIRVVLGNHDNTKVLFNLMPLIASIDAYRTHGKFLLTHMPVDVSQSERWELNIHGHLHEEALDSPWHRCVSVERTDYKPVLLQSFSKT